MGNAQSLETRKGNIYPLFGVAQNREIAPVARGPDFFKDIIIELEHF